MTVSSGRGPAPLRPTDCYIRGSYDAAAEACAEHLSGELVRKPLDRHLLNRAGLAVIERVEREPDEGAEYPSRRGYLVARGGLTRATAR